MRKPKNYWTIETTRYEALLYSNRRKFKLGSSAAYQAALKGGWLDKICEHMVNPQRPYGYWDFLRVHVEALKYSTRNDFKIYSGSAYKVALDKNWIDFVCSHMIPQGSRKRRIIYEIADHSRRIVYVGLTYSLNIREAQHKRNDKITDVFGHDFTLKPLTAPLPNDIAIQQEIYFVNHYRLMGYEVLNVAKAGSIGGGYQKWSDEDICSEAMKFKTRTEFKQHRKGMYAAAFERNISHIAFSHMPKRAPKSR